MAEVTEKVNNAVYLQSVLEQRLKKEKSEDASRPETSAARVTGANEDLQNEIDNLFDSGNLLLSS
ncbi:MAG TPA: hypothetical protein PLT23_12720, partial [Lentisphaeria bacterium]|nr:hypothetical protein [Lentisphaeria bacterium]